MEDRLAPHMPTVSLPTSVGYSFATWPANPPVFEAMAVPAQLHVPLAPRIPTGSPATVVIIAIDRPGQIVAERDRLAPAVEGAHAPLAPAGGVVGTQVVPVPIIGGDLAPAVRIDANADAPPDLHWSPADDATAIDRLDADPSRFSAWIDRIRGAGVWANRKTSPDLLAQLHQSLRRPVDAVVCTVLDVDPSACLNAALAAQYPLELVAGVTLLRSVSQANRAMLVMDARIPPTWTEACRRAGRATLRLISMVNEYPQADPTLMLYTLFDRRLRPGRLPTDQGVILLDAAAAIAIGRVALSGGAMTSVPLVVRDHVLRQSFFAFAPVGASLSEIVRQLRVSTACTTFRAGDVLRDVRATGEAVVAAGGEMILHASPPEPPINPDPCIRCAWCIESCPTRVQPAGVLEAAQHDDVDLADAYGVEACIECGICSYVCPSRLPLFPAATLMRERAR